MRAILFVGVLAFLAFQHDPVPCGREDDKARPEELVACECYRDKDPCTEGEERSCKSYCKKKQCGCCVP